jgi:hypothetical protein
MAKSIRSADVRKDSNSCCKLTLKTWSGKVGFRLGPIEATAHCSDQRDRRRKHVTAYENLNVSGSVQSRAPGRADAVGAGR